MNARTVHKARPHRPPRRNRSEAAAEPSHARSAPLRSPPAAHEPLPRFRRPPRPRPPSGSPPDELGRPPGQSKSPILVDRFSPRFAHRPPASPASQCCRSPKIQRRLRSRRDRLQGLFAPTTHQSTNHRMRPLLRSANASPPLPPHPTPQAAPPLPVLAPPPVVPAHRVP